jgi:hypothetical protein
MTGRGEILFGEERTGDEAQAKLATRVCASFVLLPPFTAYCMVLLLSKARVNVYLIF